MIHLPRVPKLPYPQQLLIPIYKQLFSIFDKTTIYLKRYFV